MMSTSPLQEHDIFATAPEQVPGLDLQKGTVLYMEEPLLIKTKGKDF